MTRSKKLTSAFYLILLLCSSASFAKDPPAVSIDLRKAGPPSDFDKHWSGKQCPVPYMGYKALQWIDAQRVVVAFNTNELCPNTNDWHAPGNVKLATFNLRGNLLHKTDLTYEAAIQVSVPHNGLWIGPGQTVLLESPYLVGSSNGKVRVLNQNLESLQEIETQSDETTKEYKTFTHFGIRFEGVTADREAVIFSKDTGHRDEQRRCLLYTGVPIAQTSECSPAELAAAKKQLVERGSYAVPKGHEVYSDVAGASVDGSRSSVFIAKEENALCQLSGALCPSHGELIVYETSSNRILFRRQFSIESRLAVAPDGKHVAAFTKNVLEIFAVP